VFLYLRASHDPEQSGIFVGDIDSTPEQQPSARVIATPGRPAITCRLPTRAVNNGTGCCSFER